MATVGILSFHESTSYGAILQCTALQRTIQKLGHESEFIDFDRHSSNRLDMGRGLKRRVIGAAVALQRVLFSRHYREMKAKFASFSSRHLNVGQTRYSSEEELINDPPRYASYVTGSDQVWNPNNGLLRAFGLTFAPGENTISYAASIGVKKIPGEKRDYMKSCLDGVRHVSCRESEGALELQHLLDREVATVLDPTLLLTAEEWKSFCSGREFAKPYVLAYFLGSLTYPRAVAERVSRELNARLVMLPQNPRDMFSLRKSLFGIGPSEFLTLVRDASFVCTDSFHGTCFSIVFHKAFLAFPRRGYQSAFSGITRIKNILSLLGLQERLILEPDDDVQLAEQIDYEEVDAKLARLRESSVGFLSEALKAGSRK